jgi:hypothetical protein
VICRPFPNFPKLTWGLQKTLMIADIYNPDISTLLTRGHFYFGWTAVDAGIDSTSAEVVENALCHQPSNAKPHSSHGKFIDICLPFQLASQHHNTSWMRDSPESAGRKTHVLQWNKRS